MASSSLCLDNVPTTRPDLRARLGSVAVLLIFLVALNVPPIQATSDLYVRSELIVLVLCIVGYAWLLLAGLVRPIRVNAMFAAALVFSICVVMSMIYGTDVLHHELLYRDYFEIPKAWLPALFFTMTFESQLPEKAVQRFWRFLIIPTSLVCLYAWAQYFNLGISYFLNNYFSGGEHVDLALRRYSRVYSTFGNPNVLGQFLSFAIISYTAAFLFEVGSRARNVAIAIACLITMVLTGSRYALLATGLGLILLMLIVVSERRPGAKMLGLFLLLAVFSYTFMTVQRNTVHQQKRFQELRHPADVSSVRQRLDGLWREAGDYITSSPFVGHGPAKQLFTGVFTDSEYLDILKQFGFVGFIPYLCLYLWPLYYLWKGRKTLRYVSERFRTENPATLLNARIGFVVVIMALFMNIGMFTYLNWEVLGFLWLLMGLCTRSAMNILSEYEGTFFSQVAAP
jgi:O-antigen ligase